MCNKYKLRNNQTLATHVMPHIPHLPTHPFLVPTSTRLLSDTSHLPPHTPMYLSCPLSNYPTSPPANFREERLSPSMPNAHDILKGANIFGVEFICSSVGTHPLFPPRAQLSKGPPPLFSSDRGDTSQVHVGVHFCKQLLMHRNFSELLKNIQTANPRIVMMAMMM